MGHASPDSAPAGMARVTAQITPKPSSGPWSGPNMRNMITIPATTKNPTSPPSSNDATPLAPATHVHAHLVRPNPRSRTTTAAATPAGSAVGRKNAKRDTASPESGRLPSAIQQRVPKATVPTAPTAAPLNRTPAHPTTPRSLAIVSLPLSRSSATLCPRLLFRAVAASGRVSRCRHRETRPYEIIHLRNSRAACGRISSAGRSPIHSPDSAPW